MDIRFACFLILIGNFVVGLNPFPYENWNSGFIDVDTNSLYYYLFKCRDTTIPTRLTLWLQGGPGYSNAFSVFAEGGAYVVNNKTKEIERNIYAWNEVSDTLFIDQPAPTNFSISRDPSKVCKNMSCVAKDLYGFLIKFYEMYPQYKKAPLYITGVSYGGHYVPYLAYYITQMNNENFNIQGLAIGNGLIDYYTQIWHHPTALYRYGLISWYTYYYLESKLLMCAIAHAFGVQVSEISCTQTIFSMFNELNLKVDPYDLNETTYTYDIYETPIVKYLNTTEVQKAFGVNGTFIPTNEYVYEMMKPDFQLEISGYIGKLLDKGMKIFIFFGENDYICGFDGGIKVTESIPWSGQSNFLKAEFKDLKIDSVIYAKHKRYKNLHLMKVHDAGHTIFFKQRKFALDLLKALIDPKF